MAQIELSRNQLGRLGETAVALELMKRGYDVINLNDAIKNFQNADLLCVSSESGKTLLIQVKTGSTKNIQCGLVSTTDGVIKDLDKKIICPWVFVHVTTKGNNNYSFEFFVLTREETIELIKTSNDWYTNQWNRKLKNDVLVGVDVDWLRGQGSKESPNLHPESTSSLQVTSENRWDKIAL